MVLGVNTTWVIFESTRLKKQINIIMGNRSYLYLKENEQELELFEANNSLPFFWLCLIDKKILHSKLPHWQALETFLNDESLEEDPEYEKMYLKLSNQGLIVINKEQLENNSVKSRAYFSRHYPLVVALYDDFIQFLAQKIYTQGQIELDILEISSFYESLQDFYESLKDALQAIENNSKIDLEFFDQDDLIAFGTGFASMQNKSFALQPSYVQALKQRDKPKAAKQNKAENQEFKKKDTIVYLILLLICPFFSYFVISEFLEHGIYFTLVVMALANLGFYFFTIYGLLLEYKAYKNK